MDLSIVIPVYNSAETLNELVKRLFIVMKKTNKDFEIIFVDDGSVDNSWEAIKKLQQCHSNTIIAVQLMRNFGQHNALMCGLRKSNGKYIITMDDDLQNPPEEIPKLINAIEKENLDLVYGLSEDKKHKKWRNIGTIFIRLFYKIVFKSHVNTTSFRIISRDLAQSIFSYELNYTYIDGLLAWNTKRIGNVLVVHHARTTGSSGYSLSKLMTLALNLFTNFSLIPLQFVSALGILTAFSGFATGIYYLVQFFLSNIAIPGYASTIITTLILSGTQLLALGIIGEYLGRLHLNVNNKPQYTERTVLTKKGSISKKSKKS